MPWQQQVADVVLEIIPETGRLAYSEFGLTVPRQSGKSTFILAKSVHRASAGKFFGPRQNVVYTAQTRKDARKKWEEDYAAELEASRVFRSRVQVHKGNGNEHIRFTNGSRFGIESSTEKAGHGGTLDEAYIDEAFAQVDNRLEQAFGPAMITRRNKQLGWISTAGWEAASPFLEEKTKLGRLAVESGRTTGLAYFEWSAPEDCDPSDPDVWWSCMPALGHTITVEDIQAEYEKAAGSGKINDFKRAYLNLWVPKPVVTSDTIIPEAVWNGARDPASNVVGPPSFALYVTPDRGWAAIAASGLNEASNFHVEITSYQDEIDTRSGTDWVVPRLADMKTRFPALRVAMSADSAAKSLQPELERLGIPVDLLPAGQVKAACGLFYDRTVNGSLRHLGQPQLTAALFAARKHQEDGETAWKWGHRRSTGGICELYAATLALWAADEALNMSRHPVMNVW
jgi:Phage Terminase